MRGIALTPHAFQRFHAATVRNERAYRNGPAHRRRNISRPSSATVKWITFVTSQALTNQSVIHDCAVVLDWYQNTNDLDKADIYNEMGWQADAGVEGYAVWRPADKKWILILIPCPAGSS